MRIGDYFLQQNENSMGDGISAISFYVYMSADSVYIQITAVELELRKLSDKDIQVGREVTASDERKEGLKQSWLIHEVTLIPSGFKARIVPLKYCGEIIGDDQSDAWRLLGIEDQLLDVDTIQV